MNPTFLSKYTLINKIGEGSFSEVLKCEDRQTGVCFAAKRLKKVFKSTFDVANCAEIIAMNKLAKHPNIVYMVEFHYDPASGRLVFVFELMDMSMYDFLKLKRRRISESKVRQFLYQILKGLDHLHSHGLFHRDIKPENILIKLPNPRFICSQYQFQGEIVKLADFGSIRGIYSKQPYTEYISTRWYRSPECLLTVGYYGPKMDVWATGCVFYEMLTLKPLFAGHDEIDQLARIHTVLGTPNERTLRKLKKKSRNFSHFTKQLGVGFKSLNDKVSDDAITILQLMVQYDPDLRINVRRLLDHRFFRSLRDDEIIQKFKYHIKDYSSDFLNKSKGDFQSIFNVAPHGKKNKYKSSSSKSSNRSEKKISGIPLRSKTNTNAVDYKSPAMHNYNLRSEVVPLVDQKQMKSWGVNPNILKPKNENKKKQEEVSKIHVPIKIKPSPRFHLKRSVLEAQGFSKTTSNLPQISTYRILEGVKAKQFQSKSFILPSRHMKDQFTMDGTQLTIYKSHEQKTNKKNYKSIRRNS